MLFTTPTQFAACALLFVAGWLFGLASHPGGRKWKERYLAERDAHAANRKTWEAEHTTLTAQTDERVAAAKAGLDEREAAHRDRIAELERENEELRRAPATTGQTFVPRGRREPRVVETNRGQRGWFDFS